MNASLPHGSMLRYEDNPFFVSSQSATQAASSPRCHAQANSSERISMELEILEAGSRAGHDLSGPHRQGYQQHRATVRPVQPGSSSHRGPYALLGEAFRKPRLHPSSSTLFTSPRFLSSHIAPMGGFNLRPSGRDCCPSLTGAFSIWLFYIAYQVFQQTTTYYRPPLRYLASACRPRSRRCRHGRYL